MATIKAFSDLQQSKKLAEILPIESADMYWWSSGKRYYIEAMEDAYVAMIERLHELKIL